MSKNDGSQVPTWNQAQTLKLLIEGWELIVTEWCDASYQIMLDGVAGTRRRKPSRERIYWRKERDNPSLLWTHDTLECGNPRMKRHHMSHMERYGWVEKHDDGWTITDAGRAARKRYDDWWAKVSA